MALFLRSLYLATALSFGYMLAVYYAHPARRLPLIPLMAAFVTGLLCVVPVIAVRALSGGGPGSASLLGTAALEEAVKLAAVLLLIARWREPELMEPLDLAVYFGILGVGFGVFEDFWYIFGSTSGSWLQGDIARFRAAFGWAVAARALPGHILFNAVSGLILGYSWSARDRRRRGALLLAAFASATVLHAGFNAAAEWGGTVLLLAYVTALVGLALALRRWAWAGSGFRAVIDAASSGEPPRSADAVKLLLAEGFGWPGRPRSRRFQLFPIALSLIVLYPLLFATVYAMAWGVARLLERR
jgi:RsiW-degrading membrane proteinase PrsW (M82 family)